MEKSKPKSYKYCIVPQCKSTSVTAPDKIFISLPTNTKTRKLWQIAMRRSDFVGDKTNAVVCENHFNLEEDMENYVCFKLMKNVPIKMKVGVVPHIFDCQKDRKGAHSAPPRQAFKKRRILEIVDKPSLLSPDAKKLKISKTQEGCSEEKHSDDGASFTPKQCYKSVQVNIKPEVISKETQCNLFKMERNRSQKNIIISSSDDSKISSSSKSYDASSNSSQSSSGF